MAKLSISYLFAAIVLVVTNSYAGDMLFLKNKNVTAEDAQHLMAIEPESLAGHFFVVQFAQIAGEKEKSLLRAHGLEVKSYLPDDAYIVKGDSEKALKLNSVKGVKMVSPYHTSWRMSSQFSPLSIFTRDQELTVWVRAIDRQEVKSLVTSLAAIPDTRLLQVQGKIVAMQVTRASLEKVAALDGVEWVEPIPQVTTFHFDNPDAVTTAAPGDYSDITGYESGTKLMNLDAAWARGFNGSGQIASVADTGVDVGDVTKLHQDLSNVWRGYAFGLYSTDWSDPQGHGTHVTGSVVGTGRASGGKLRGGAWGARIVAEGMWSTMLDNITPPPQLNRLFSKAYSDGARINTNSWGSPQNLGDYDAMAAQVDEFMWNNPDFLILFAAGNSGEDKDANGIIDEGSVSSPGTAKNCLTVGASKNFVLNGGIQKKMGELRGGAQKWGAEPIASSRMSELPDGRGMAAFSSRGPTLDKRLKPEISAPGTNILSVQSQHPKASKLWGAYNSDYAWAGGTSMATPLTAGAATVTRQYLVEAMKQQNPSSALMKAAMVHTAFDMFPGQFAGTSQQEFATPRPNNHEGYGRVDMDALTQLAATGAVVDDVVGVGQGEQKTAQVQVAQGVLRVTMAYTDAPGAASSGKALVNDLDLKIVDAKGNAYSTNDHTNNIEMVELKGLTPGVYTIVVSGYRVPTGKNGKQPYALVISK